MKRIKRLLVFILCAFTVLCTVGFLNVNAATENLNAFYTETFETFDANTTYNNTSEKLNGPEGKKWGLLGGTISTGSPLSGNKSYQSRYYSNVPDHHLEIKYDIDNVSKITFLARSGANKTNKIVAKISTNSGKTWSSGQTFELTQTSNEYTVDLSSISTPATLRVKFEIIYASDSIKKDAVFIDDVKFYELSNIQKFTINFNTNGGTAINSKNVIADQLVEKPVNPTKENYNFVDWYTTPEFTPGTEYNFSTPVTANLTLYAKWEETSYFNFIGLKTGTSLNMSYTSTTSVVNGNIYEKVTANQEDWTGTYIAVYEDGTDAYVFNGKDEENGNKLATITGTNIIIDDSYDECKLTIAKIEGQTEQTEQYSIARSTIGLPEVDTKKIYMSGVNDQNKLEFLENPAPNEITYDNTTNSIDIKTFNRYFRFNSSNSKGHRFRYYDGAKQKDIQLYKLVSSGETTVTNYQFSDISLRFGILFSKAEYDKMIVEGATFGVELTNKKDSKTINVPCTPARVDQSGLESETGEFYQFAAVIEGITEAQYALEIDARCYVEINGVKHYLKKATNSVISIAKTYVTESDTSAYTQHLDALKALSNK